jgi:murein DD-endopeptidase MepM/ murein hydrolase activator NlpD
MYKRVFKQKKPLYFMNATPNLMPIPKTGGKGGCGKKKGKGGAEVGQNINYLIQGNVNRDLGAEEDFIKKWQGGKGILPQGEAPRLPTPQEVNAGVYKNSNVAFNTKQTLNPTPMPKPDFSMAGMPSKVDNSSWENFKKSGTVTTKFGGKTSYEPYHKGIDISSGEGKSIPAFTGGKIISVISGKSWTPGQPDYGNQVVIMDPKTGLYYQYSHLQKPSVAVGQEVKAGDEIGIEGHTGGSYSVNNPNDPNSAAHLDFRIYNWVLNNKHYLNPEEML